VVAYASSGFVWADYLERFDCAGVLPGATVLSNTTLLGHTCFWVTRFFKIERRTPRIANKESTEERWRKTHCESNWTVEELFQPDEVTVLLDIDSRSSGTPMLF